MEILVQTSHRGGILMSPIRLFRYLLLVSVCSLAAGTASAQTRAALVKNVDEPGRTPYQTMVDFDPNPPVCSGAICIIRFPAVPAGKRLVVEHVSVLVGVSGGGQPSFLAFGDFAVVNSNNIAIITPVFANTGINMGGVMFWALDRPVRVYFEAGAVPKLKLILSTNPAFVGEASVVGYLIDATN